MSEELTPLDALTVLKFMNEINCWFDFDFTNIEKSLKALEIIKENIKHFITFEDETNSVYIDCSINCKSQEEYKMLKEELEKGE